MGLLGNDIFDVVNATTARLKKEKNEKEAFRRYILYNDLEAKQYLENTGHKPLPPSLPELRENQRQSLLEAERLRQKQQHDETQTVTQPRPIIQPTRVDTVIMTRQPTHLSSIVSQPTQQAPSTAEKLQNIIQNKSTWVESGVGGGVGLIFGGDSRILAMAAGVISPILIKLIM
jgi:hypothetical protein